MKRERRDVRETITRMSTLAVLSALGFVLMAFAKFPYPMAPWLKVEVSELVVILAYALYGLPGGLIVAIVKTLLNIAVNGLVGYGVGDATAFITSCLFILSLFLTSHVFKWFKKGLLFRVISYIFVAVFVSVIMTGLNALFITPTFLTTMTPSPRFSTCFDEGVIQAVTKQLTGNKEIVANGGIYLGAMCTIYIPFNLMKAGICCFGYELLFNRLIFVFMRKSEFFKKYFVGNIFLKEVEEPNPSIEETEENKE